MDLGVFSNSSIKLQVPSLQLELFMCQVKITQLKMLGADSGFDHGASYMTQGH